MKRKASKQKIAPFVSFEQTHKALKQWSNAKLTESALDNLLLHRQASAHISNMHERHLRVLLPAVEQLAIEDAEAAALLEQRFQRKKKVEEVGHQIGLSGSSLYRAQHKAIEQLAAILNQHESAARAQRLFELEHRLEDRTYSRLIGVTGYVEQLVDKLYPPDTPFVAAIEGMGGLGKTTLADAAVRRAAHDLAFTELVWVTARQQSLNLGGGIRRERDESVNVAEIITMIFDQVFEDADVKPIALTPDAKQQALRNRLAKDRYLIVIDNLETLEDVENLMPVVRRLRDPSKFILTSRESLFNEPGIHHIRLTEMNEDHALELIYQEADEQGVEQITKASRDELLPIYEVVGGNPLALRLVVGQVHTYTLDWVLAGLKGARGLTALNLYTYLYRQVWDTLDETTRDVFTAMPLVLEQGGNLELISTISAVPQEEAAACLSRLIRLNLVDSHGELNNRHFTIHSLTRTFLHEVIHWQ
ncbi:MAG: NB-ARC domain-containing protein [Anaerolineae bacterium]